MTKKRETGDLYAEHTDDVWTVVDPAGGRWWPSPLVAALADDHTDPEAFVLAVCRADPMRGTWRT